MRFLGRWLPVILWAAVILAASNGSFSAERSGGWFRSVFGFELPYVIHVMVRKAAHVVEYSILAALAWRARRGYLVPLVIALAVAATDETLQSLTSTRTGTPFDVLLDLCAAFIAVALCQRIVPSPRPLGGEG
jgi:VanZ family protein